MFCGFGVDPQYGERVTAHVSQTMWQVDHGPQIDQKLFCVSFSPHVVATVVASGRCASHNTCFVGEVFNLQKSCSPTFQNGQPIENLIDALKQHRFIARLFSHAPGKWSTLKRISSCKRNVHVLHFCNERDLELKPAHVTVYTLALPM